MESFIQSLQKELQTRLDLIDPKMSPVRGYDKKMKEARGIVLELKRYVVTHPFPDKMTEIQFFKHWLPAIYSRYIYFSSLYMLERNRITSSTEDFACCVDQEIRRVATFLREHHELYFYYKGNETDKDEWWFVCMPLPDGHDLIKLNEQFCQASLVLSQLLAYDEYKKILVKEASPTTERTTDTDDIQLDWDGTKAEAVEQICLLYETQLLKHKGMPATQDQIRGWWKQKLSTDLNNFSVIDRKNRDRKITTSPLLDKFIRADKARKTALILNDL